MQPSMVAEALEYQILGLHEPSVGLAGSLQFLTRDLCVCNLQPRGSPCGKCIRANNLQQADHPAASAQHAEDLLPGTPATSGAL